MQQCDSEMTGSPLPPPTRRYGPRLEDGGMQAGLAPPPPVAHPPPTPIGVLQGKTRRGTAAAGTREPAHSAAHLRLPEPLRWAYPQHSMDPPTTTTTHTRARALKNPTVHAWSRRRQARQVHGGSGLLVRPYTKEWKQSCRRGAFCKKVDTQKHTLRRQTEHRNTHTHTHTHG